MTTITHNNLSLHLFEKPAKKDISFIKENFSFHPSVIEELAHPTLHPKIELYENHAFLVLRFPQFDKKEHHNLIASEVDFIFAQNQLILVQYQDFEALDILITQLSHEEEQKNQYFKQNAGYLLYKIIDHLFRSLYTELDHITNKVDESEEKIFDGKEEKMLELISYHRREATNFRRIIKPNLDVFRELESAFTSLYDKDTAFYISSIESTSARLASLIENHIETLHILHETNSALLSNKINKIIKVLTLFTGITFPLTIISNIWSMNFAILPLYKNPHGFIIVMTLMIASILLMVSVFKIKKWL